MRKISCDVYQDILPLYADDVVSQDTREFVEDHLRVCATCREELEKMHRPIVLPSENAKPLESIKMQWERKNALVWVLAVGLLAAFLLMAMPFLDTAMQYHIQDLVWNTEDYWYLLLPLAVVGFGLEWWLIRPKRGRWLKFIPLAIPTALLILTEIIWGAGGWNRIGSSILWWLGFPLLLGAGTAALLRVTLDQNRQGRRIIALVLACGVTLAAFFWPKRMYDTIPVEPEQTMLSVYTDGQREWLEIPMEEVERLLKFSKIAPCVTGPDWEENRCILLRLDENHVLMAPHGDAPYVYEYTGPLEEFDGRNVCYRMDYFTALYIELKTAARTVEK